MPNNVDERIVEMRFENKDFEQNAKESISTLDRLKKALNLDSAAKGIDQVSKAASSFSIDSMVKNISNGVDQINSRFGIFGRVVQNMKDEVASGLTSIVNETVKTVSALTPLTQMASEVKGVATTITGALQQMNQAANMGMGWEKYAEKTGAVQTIMNATGKSIQEVEDQLGELMWFSDETSYSFTDMTSNVGKFTSQGIDLETSVKAMMGVANAAALAGANSAEASRAMYNISQAMGAGSMKLIDWKSIENANMATSQLKQSMIDAGVAVGTLKDKGDGTFAVIKDGVEKDTFTVASFNTQLAAGWLNTEAMLKAFQEYGGYADVVFQKATEEGLTCAEAMEALGDEYGGLGKKAFKAAQEAKTFRDVIDATKDAVSSQWSKIFQEIFGNYEEARTIWTWWANRFYELFADPLWDTADLFGEWHEGGGYTDAIDGIVSAWWGLMDIIEKVEEAWERVFPKITADNLLDATAAFKDGMKGFYDFFNYTEKKSFKEQAAEAYEGFMDWSKGINYTDEELQQFADTAEEWGVSVGQLTQWAVKDYVDGFDQIAHYIFGGDTQKAMESMAKTVSDAITIPRSEAGKAEAAMKEFREMAGSTEYSYAELKQAADDYYDELGKSGDIHSYVAEGIKEYYHDLDAIVNTYYDGDQLKALDAMSKLYVDTLKNSDTSVQKTMNQVDKLMSYADNATYSYEHLAEAAHDAYPDLTADNAAFKMASETIYNYFDGLQAIADQDYAGDKQKAADDLAKMYIDRLQELDEQQAKAEARSENLQNTVEGLASAFDIVRQAVSAVKEVFIDPVLAKIPDVIDWILEKTGNLGTKITDFATKLREENFFTKTLTKWRDNFSEFISKVSELESVKKFLGYLKELKDWASNLIKTDLPGFFDGVGGGLGKLFTVDNAVGLLDGFVNGINWLIETAKAAWPQIQPVITGVIDGLGKAYDAAVQFFGSADWENFKTIIGQIFGTSWDDFTTGVQNAWGLIVGFVEEDIANGKFIDIGKQMAQQLLQGAREHVQSVDWGKVLMDAIKLGGLSAFFYNLIGTFANIKKATGGLENLPALLEKVLSGVTGALKGFAMNMRAEAFLKVTAGIALIAFALYEIAKVDQQALAQATAAVFMISLAAAAVIAAMAKLNDAKAKRMNARPMDEIGEAISSFSDAASILAKKLGTAAIIASIGTTFLAIALSIGIIVGAVLLLQKFSGPKLDKAAEDLWNIMSPIILLMITIVGATAILEKTGSDMKDVAKTISTIGNLMLKFAVSLLIMVGVVAIFGVLSKALGDDFMNAILAVGIIIGAMTIMMGVTAAAASLMDNGAAQNLSKLGNMMLKIAAAFLIFTIVIGILTGLAAINGGAFTKAVVSIVAIVGALVILIGVLGILAALTTSGKIDMGNFESLVTSLMMIAAAMLMIAAGAALMASAGANIKTVGIMLLGFLGILALFVVAALAVKALGLETALDAISTALMGLGIMVAAVGIGVLAFAAGMMLLSQNIEAIPAVLAAIGQGIVAFGEAIGGNVEAVVAFILIMVVMAAAAVAVGYAIANIVNGMRIVLEALEPFLKKLADNVPKMKTVLIAAIALLIIGLLEFITGAMPNVVDTLVKLILVAINSLALAIMDNAYYIGEALRNVVLALLDMLVEVIAGMLSIPQDAVRGFLGFTDSLSGDITGRIESLNSEVNENLGEMGDGVAENLGKVEDAITNFNPTVKSPTVEFDGSSTITNPLDSDAQRQKQFSSAGASDAGAYTEAFNLNLGEGFDVTNLTDSLGNVDLTGALENGFDISALEPIMSNMGTEGAEGLLNTQNLYQSAGVDLMDAGTDGIESESSTLASAAGSAAEEGADAVSAKEADMNVAGRNLMRGAIKGVDAYAPALISRVKSIAQSAVDAFNATIGAASPAKKTIQSGKWFDQGFIVGVNQFSGHVTAAAQSLGNDAVETMSDAVSRASDIINGTLEPDMTIRPVVDLTDITSGVGQINSLFSNFHPEMRFSGIGQLDSIGTLRADLSAQNRSYQRQMNDTVNSLRGDVRDLGGAISKMKVVLNSKKVVGGIGKEMDQYLGNQSSR